MYVYTYIYIYISPPRILGTRYQVPGTGGENLMPPGRVATGFCRIAIYMRSYESVCVCVHACASVTCPYATRCIYMLPLRIHMQ